jgi:hypothetical protein
MYNKTLLEDAPIAKRPAMSRPVTVSIPHSLGKDEARRRIEEGFGRMRQQMTSGMGAMGSMLTFQERWEGDRLHFEGGGLGQKMTGRLDVRPDAVDIQLDLPEILAAIAETITGRLKSEGQKLLEKK